MLRGDLHIWVHGRQGHGMGQEQDGMGQELGHDQPKQGQPKIG